MSGVSAPAFDMANRLKTSEMPTEIASQPDMRSATRSVMNDGRANQWAMPKRDA